MRGWLRSVSVFFVFCVALGVTARLLNEVKLFAEIPGLRDKWGHYLAHKDEYDTLIIGTSRTYRGIMPSVFDELTAAANVPTRTFNFGLDGMFPPEDAYVAEHVLRNPPKNLRWVVLEIGVFMDDFKDRNPDQVRCVHWHDLNRTLLCTRSQLWPKKKPEKWKYWFQSEKGKAAPASDILTHWRLFFVKTLNLGRGSELLGNRFMNRRGKGEGTGPANDGFCAMPPEKVMNAEALATYKKDVEQRMEKPARLAPLSHYGEECLARVVARVREIGAQPIVFLAPAIGSKREYPSDALGVPMIDLCVPAEVPELFDPAVRSDPGHVNARGADAMTRRFTEKFVSLARSQSSLQTPSPSRLR
jgi:hypothetical protein